MKISKTILAALLPLATMGTTPEGTFTKVELNSVGKVIIAQGDSNAVEVNTSGSKDGIKTKIKENTLFIESSVDAEYRVTMKNIDALSVGGTGEISSNGTLVSEALALDVSGSGKMTLALDVKKLDVDISGVGKMTLSGKAESASIEISGSGKVEAFDLTVTDAKAEISGVGKCNIDVRNSLTSEVSGMGSVNYKTRPAHVNSEVSGIGKISDNEDSDGGHDTTRLSFGQSKVLIIRSDSVVAERKAKQQKSKPIWAGFEIGFNNYVNSDGAAGAPDGYDFLDLNTGKSVAISLNLLQKNFRLGHSNAWFFTGLGVTWNNYRFDKNALLNSSGDTLTGGFDTTSTRNFSKSKLTSVYLTVPLMFEFFTSKKYKNAFHFGVGAIAGYKIGSHTKARYTEAGSTEKPKQYDDFYLNPFRYGVRVAIGYKKFNLFADYYASTLFRENKGPELFPVSVGITLASF